MEDLKGMFNYEKEMASGTLHIRMLKYLMISATQEEMDSFTEEETINLEFDNGFYGIQFGDLKIKADEETTALLVKYKDLNDIKIDEDEEDNN